MSITKIIESPDDLGSTRVRKAVLWGRADLLARAVEFFLESRMTWEVIRISNEDGLTGLFTEMQRICPDVVILCWERDESDSTLPEQLIRQQLSLKVVSVSLESNVLQVYSKHNVVVRGVSDLLSVVEAGYFQNHTCHSGGENQKNLSNGSLY